MITSVDDYFNSLFKIQSVELAIAHRLKLMSVKISLYIFYAGRLLEGTRTLVKDAVVGPISRQSPSINNQATLLVQGSSILPLRTSCVVIMRTTDSS